MADSAEWPNATDRGLSEPPEGYSELFPPRIPTQEMDEPLRSIVRYLFNRLKDDVWIRGLNADKLDGLDASGFALAAHTHSGLSSERNYRLVDAAGASSITAAFGDFIIVDRSDGTAGNVTITLPSVQTASRGDNIGKLIDVHVLNPGSGGQSVLVNAAGGDFYLEADNTNTNDIWTASTAFDRLSLKALDVFYYDICCTVGGTFSASGG